MQNAMNQMANSIRNFFVLIGNSFMKMGKQIENYVDEQIEERYQNMRTGKFGEDEKIRAGIKLKAGIVFIFCLIVILTITVTFIFSLAKDKLDEITIKSPNEIMMNLDDKAEMYPVVEVAAGFYIPEEVSV